MTTTFEPIAIVGQGCVLPGANNPECLWDLISQNKQALSEVPNGSWGKVNPDNSPWHGKGGRANLPLREELATFDPIMHWLFEAYEQSCQHLKHTSNTGIIIGNLSYPTHAMNELAKSFWLAGRIDDNPLNRLMSGYPVQKLAQHYNLHGPAFAIDAACASSLYAIKLACDALHNREVDTIIAGGINGIDDLFLHVGFTELSAISPTGQSRPFHKAADGLIPATGAALISLKRLDDAEKENLPILGVIRGIGLSNDGKEGGLLSPASLGQLTAMQRAYQCAGMNPSEISYIECHATGTPVGDVTELESMSSLLTDNQQSMSIGSLKSNLGHLVTAAGAAGILKVLGAMKHHVIPATLHTDDTIDYLADSQFNLVKHNQKWHTHGTKKAAVSAFGFGGNNAHLIIEEYQPGYKYPSVVNNIDNQKIAVVAIAQAKGEPKLDTTQLRQNTPFPPNDLDQLHGHQLVMMSLADEILAQIPKVNSEMTSVVIGLGTETDAARYYTRLQAEEDQKDQITPELNATRTLGCMPNVPANRLNVMYGFAGPSFTCSAESLSGIEALKIACQSIANNEIETALVGAVDLCANEFDQAVFQKIFSDNELFLQDGAVMLALKSEVQAIQDGDQVLAVIEQSSFKRDYGFTASRTKKPSSKHYNHAAGSLLKFVEKIRETKIAAETFYADALTGQQVQFSFSSSYQDKPKLYLYSAIDKKSLIHLLSTTTSQYDLSHAHRLAIVINGGESLEAKKALALAALKSTQLSSHRIAPGVFYADKPIDGKLAFTFPSSAGAYQGMGQALLNAFPDVLSDIQSQVENSTGLNQVLNWLYGDIEEGEYPVFDKLKAALFLSVVHGKVSQQICGLQADAYIGFSAGETAALFVSNTWQDLNAYYQAVESSKIWTKHLAGELTILDKAWQDHSDINKSWQVWRVHCKQAILEKAIEAEPLVHIATINYPGDYSICGESTACARVTDIIGSGYCQRLHYDLVHHCPEMFSYKEQWLALTTRNVVAPSAKLYGAFQNGEAYLPNDENVQQALLEMATQTVNYPQIIKQAYQDGVRVFLEHGPRSSCTSYIEQILKDKPIVAISLDAYGISPLKKLYEALAHLYVIGVMFDYQKMRTGEFPMKSYELHLPEVDLTESNYVMPSAPELPSVLEMAQQQTLPTGSVSFLEQLSNCHQSYLATQLKTHQQYMAIQQQLIIGGDYRSAEPPPTPIKVKQDERKDWGTAVKKIKPGVKEIALSKKAQSSDNQLFDKSKQPIGPTFDKEQLKVHASGEISTIFGELFKQQDQYPVQVRMPTEPMLLADRVTGIDAEPGSLGLGTVWTESDIKNDSWYVFQDHILPGIMIECGQADLFLISYLGIDFKNKGERAYRLLGCEVSFMAPLPKPGDTLKYDIHIDSHAIDGKTHLFFFHYDCYVGDTHVLKVRNGQAGFFSNDDLHASRGVIWDPSAIKLEENPRLESPALLTKKSSFTKAELEAFSNGDLISCFGEEFYKAHTHTRTPSIPKDKLLLIDEVTTFDIKGGPWARGYLKAHRDIQEDDWFFEGHFKNDPCMPGTLMTEMAFQGMIIYLAAMGFTLDRDGWTFSPTVDESVKLACRGQVLPTSKQLTLEIFVREVVTFPEPVLYADIISTVDGLKALYAERIHLRLMVDYPTPLRAKLPNAIKSRLSKNVTKIDNIPCDEKQAQDCAWGKPSEAFGYKFKDFDQGKRLSRLPGDPYMFISRIIETKGIYGEMNQGSELIAEWDVPSDSIFFKENTYPTLPFCVIQETVLQPCGWLSCFMGCPLQSEQELFFRNLDGSLTLYKECLPTGATIRTHVKNTSVSKMGTTIIVAFEVSAFIDDEKLLDMNTVFGYFSESALAEQVGLPMTNVEKARMTEKNDYSVDLSENSSNKLPAGLPGKKLLMLDKLTGLWPNNKIIRAEKNVDAVEWFFKAHFYQDPVQPGSLGIEAMIQLLQSWVIGSGLTENYQRPRFEPVALNQKFSWRYRGQVVPKNKLIQTLIEVERVIEESHGILVIASSSLWCDGLKIYDASQIAVRVKESNLVEHATGDIENIFGQEFKEVDKYQYRLRLPAPPFLLFDRINHLDLSEQPTIEVQWRLEKDAWYLDGGNLQPALLLEPAGQAGIYLCSAMREDLNSPDSVYRIVSTSGMRFYPNDKNKVVMPKPDDLLNYRVTIKRQWQQGESRFYFFEYRCLLDGNLIASVDAATACIMPHQLLKTAKGLTFKQELLQKSELNRQQPSLSNVPQLSNKIWSMDDVIECKQGYLKAKKNINGDEWFFKAHFKNDPCMPAALIGAGCYEALGLYIKALGIDQKYFPSTAHDVEFIGGGQITPNDHALTFEVFVESLDNDKITSTILVSTFEEKKVFKTRMQLFI